MATIQQKQAVKDQVGNVPVKGSSMKVAIIGLIAVVAIALLLFFVNRGTGKAIVGLDDSAMSAVDVNTGGVFLLDNTLPLGTSDLGDFPVRVKFGSRTVAFTFNYTFEGAVQDCTFTLDQSLVEIAGLIVLNDVTPCDTQTGGKVEFAFLCSDASCSNALSDVKTIGLLHVTNANGNNNPISINFTNFNYVNFDSETDEIVPVTANDATIRFVDSPVCAVGDVVGCNTQLRCSVVHGYWYDNACHQEAFVPVPRCDHNHLDLCLTSATCQAQLVGGHWYADVDGVESCHADPFVPVAECDLDHLDLCLTQVTCEAQAVGGHWYADVENGVESCHAEVQGQPCVESWTTSEWGDCVNNVQTRTAVDEHSCGTLASKPVLSRECVVAPLIASMDGVGVRVEELNRVDSIYKTKLVATEDINVPITVYTTLVGVDGETIVLESRTIPSMRANEVIELRTDSLGKEVTSKRVQVWDNDDPHLWTVHLNDAFVVSYGQDVVN